MNDPRSYLGSFLEAMFRNRSHPSKCIHHRHQQPGIRAWAFPAGRSAINSNDWQQNTRHLMIGGHRFTVVQLLRVFLKRKIGWPAFRCTCPQFWLTRLVCTGTGAYAWRDFLFQPPGRSRSGAFLRRVRNKNRRQSARSVRAARSMASEMEPAFTRKFADILAAQALSLASGSAAEGVIELEELRNDRQSARRG